MKCTVCHHPQRQEIDRALAAGVSLKVLSFRHGLSRSALARHQRNHLKGAGGSRAGYRTASGTSRRLRPTGMKPGLTAIKKTDRRPGGLTPLGQIIEETQELLEQLKIWWEAQGHRDFPDAPGPGAQGPPNGGRCPGHPQGSEQERLAVGL